MFALKPRAKRTTSLLPRTEMPFDFLMEGFPGLFNRLFSMWPVEETPEWRFPWNMTTEETEKEIVVRVELPGFEPEELKVEVLPETLMIEAEKKEPTTEKPAEKVERTYAHVKRTLTLPPYVDPEKVEARYHNGVLEIHLARKPEATGRRIEVKT